VASGNFIDRFLIAANYYGHVHEYYAYYMEYVVQFAAVYHVSAKCAAVVFMAFGCLDGMVGWFGGS